VRKEFIPYWTSPSFVAFVERIEVLVEEVWNLTARGERFQYSHIVEVVLEVTLHVEEGFWPEVEG